MTREEAIAALCRHRDEIDDLDRRILALLNQRTSIVERIGQIKTAMGMPIYEPRREDEVYLNVTNNNHGPLDSGAVKRLFERIIDEMRTLQKMRQTAERQKEAAAAEGES